MDGRKGKEISWDNVSLRSGVGLPGWWRGGGRVRPWRSDRGCRKLASVVDPDALLHQVEMELGGSDDPQHVMSVALQTLGTDVAISFSGAEDIVLLEYARRTKRNFRVFSLDTGRLHPETYRLFAEAEKFFQIRIEYCFPDASQVEALVNTKGLFSFYEEGHKECCGVRKVNPLRKKLSSLRGWITGQRTDQSPSTRTNVNIVEMDTSFAGRDGVPLIKFNPLAKTSSEHVWNVIRSCNLPRNDLHLQGFKSIGCEPCTSAVIPSQHEREGRWSWEEATLKECGLHAGNIQTNEQSLSQ